MGNKKQPVEATKRKKKGRPSLLDLQKRSLRLQKQQQGQQQKQQPSNRNPKPNPNLTPQNPNPYLKFPSRRSTRRNPSPDFGEEAAAAAEDDEEEEEEDSNGKRKEKKLKLVLRIPNGSEDLDGSESESDGGSRKKRRIDSVEQTARQNSNAKATDEAPQGVGTGDPSVLGPTTALPDEKLLVFILDRLQKKDTYGVFSEPVDPEELPDYHEIIENPMDFGTVRKKLDGGAYENLEQFESDVFLISSNAMRYNAPDTIYFRQARSIQELAKKDFENLRSESDDNDQETKTVRRGRPPIKNVMKRIGRPPADRTGSDFSSDVTLANAKDGNHNSNSARDVSRKGSSFDKPTIVDAHKGNNQHRSERNEEYSGSLLKGIPVRNWKKFAALDDNRRNTYNQPLLPVGFQEPSVLTAFDGQRKLLMPVGLYMEHAYARSLARFAANLGPIAWEIAAKRIERVLPPGTKFGPGWIGENDASNQLHPLTTSTRSSSGAKPSQSNAVSGDDKTPKSHKATLNNYTLPSSGSASVTTNTNRPVESVYGTETGRLVKHEGEFGLLGGGVHLKSPLQLRQNSALQHPANGFNQGYGFNLPSQATKMAQHARSPEVAMTHCNALDMVSRSNSNSSFNNHQTPAPFTQFGPDEKVQSVVGNSNTMNSRSSLMDSNRSSEGQLRGTSLKPKPSSIPRDLNADFHSPGSPIDSKKKKKQQQQQQPQPDLALQL